MAHKRFAGKWNRSPTAQLGQRTNDGRQKRKSARHQNATLLAAIELGFEQARHKAVGRAGNGAAPQLSNADSAHEDGARKLAVAEALVFVCDGVPVST